MRNPHKTFRKRNLKPLSKNKRTRQLEIMRRLDMVGALIDLIEWRDGQMETSQ